MGKMKPQDIDKFLIAKLTNDNYYTLEALSAELGVEKADIHKSFMRLCRQPGWSIRPHNRTAYWRAWDYKLNKFGMREEPISNRPRKKGEKYDHCPAESDWERTLFKVRRPE